MTLQEAIERNQNMYRLMKEEYESEDRKAVKLLIQAGKYALRDRRGLSDCEIELLPGETKATTPSRGLPLGGITIEEQGGSK